MSQNNPLNSFETNINHSLNLKNDTAKLLGVEMSIVGSEFGLECCITYAEKSRNNP